MHSALPAKFQGQPHQSRVAVESGDTELRHVDPFWAPNESPMVCPTGLGLMVAVKQRDTFAMELLMDKRRRGVSPQTNAVLLHH